MHYLFWSDDEPVGSVPVPTTAGDVAPVPQESPAADRDDVWWQDDPTAAEQAESGELPPSSEGAITKPLGVAPAPVPQPRSAAPPEPIVPTKRGLAFAALRDVGQIRSINQDSVYGLITTVPRADSDVPIGLFVVADGMGGHEGGEIASQIAISTVARVVLADLIVPALDEAVTESLQTLLVGALQEANRNIWETAQANGTDMGTTCTAVLLLGHTVYVAHIGDSRAYLAMPDGMQVLTNDHSAVGRLIQMGQIDAEEAREHPMRSHLYRTVGQTPDVQVDYDYHQVGGATHVLLCSDGLWSMIDDATIHGAIHAAAWPQDACRALIARANAAGGEDNISAVVISLPQ